MTALAPFAADNPAKIDNNQARILVVRSEPDVKSSLHKHDMNRVMIYLDVGKMTLTKRLCRWSGSTGSNSIRDG